MQVSQEVQALIAKLRTLYDEEMAEPHEAKSAAEVPQSFESITNEWLTDALCRNVAGAYVLGHELGEIDEGTTNRRGLKVSYNDVGRRAGLPSNLFCKASFGFTNRLALGPCGAISAEVGFYNHVRPHLEIEATEGVFSVMNQAFNSITILTDISDKVSEFCTQKTQITRELAESQMRALAGLHAAGATNPRLQAAHSEFKSWYDFFHGTKLFGLDVGARAGFEAASDLIPARTHRRASEVWSATEAAVERSDTRPHTLTHGDVHLKNWYITRDGQMGLSDWQCTSHGHWGRDLSYTIATSLTIEDRRKWERDLIAYYLETLTELGGQTVSFDDAWHIYREQMLPALAWWTFTYMPTPDAPDMQPIEASIEFVRRLGTATDDLESLDA